MSWSRSRTVISTSVVARFGGGCCLGAVVAQAVHRAAVAIRAAVRSSTRISSGIEARCNVRDPMPDRKQLSAAATRQTMYAALRRSLADSGFAEVETPLLVPAPGM